MKRVLASVLLGAGLLVGNVGGAHAKRMLAPDVVPSSQAITKDIVDAVQEEMKRAMNNLQIPGAPKPYSISYKITEVEVNDAVASLGYSTSKKSRHFVSLEARVRVGSVNFDNGNFVVPGGDDIDAVSTVTLPLEATPRIARRAAWLATDSAYKEALIQLRAKMESRKAGGVGRADVPAWTEQKKLESDTQIAVPVLETVAELEARAKALSAEFRGAPHIRDSRVAVTSYLERRWYLTTEGTSVTDTRRASGVLITASSQANDGQALAQHFLRYGHTAKDLPSDQELKDEAKKISDLLHNQAKAPLVGRYVGPVLFEGEGAVGFVRQTLAPHLGGTPLPEGLRPQDAKQFGGALTEKVGLRVAANMLTFTDDPTASAAFGKALIGGYKIDDEGTPAQRVTMVKDGKLLTLLTSRTPSQRDAVSNGHARRTADGGAFHGSATNLFISAKGGLSAPALKAKLIASARNEGLGYGLLIKRFDDAAITSAPEFSRHELLNMLQTTDQALPPPALVAYKVYPNGKEELVRGVQLAELPIRTWKDVIAAGNTPFVYNYLAPSESFISLRIGGGTDNGNVPSGGIESAIITPDLLVGEIEVRTSTVGQRPVPAVARPTVPTP
ncbi:MAG TPA: metallopeptidase TldD-related protein [Kofleriaceae bacterium]|nr:metallopeptidase TldD-related protein [Kofleriaceae bacterium]